MRGYAYLDFSKGVRSLTDPAFSEIFVFLALILAFLACHRHPCACKSKSPSPPNSPAAMGVLPFGDWQSSLLGLGISPVRTFELPCWRGGGALAEWAGCPYGRRIGLVRSKWNFPTYRIFFSHVSSFLFLRTKSTGNPHSGRIAAERGAVALAKAEASAEGKRFLSRCLRNCAKRHNKIAPNVTTRFALGKKI